MPLNQSERGEVATSFLRCFREDNATCGRALRFFAQFTAGKVDLISDVKTLALTWQPFIDAGMDLASRQFWNSELQRYYDGTDTSG